MGAGCGPRIGKRYVGVGYGRRMLDNCWVITVEVSVGARLRGGCGAGVSVEAGGGVVRRVSKVPVELARVRVGVGGECGETMGAVYSLRCHCGSEIVVAGLRDFNS